MGTAARRKEILKQDFLKALNSCNQETLEYPLHKYSGIYHKNRDFLVDLYFDWLKTNQFIKLKLKEIDQWIVAFDQYIEDDIVNFKTLLVRLDLPPHYRNKAIKLIETEQGFKEKGNVNYVSLIAYCCRLMFEFDCDEVTISQAIYNPLTQKYDPGYPILHNNQPLILRKSIGEDIILSDYKWGIFKQYFQTTEFTFN